MGFLELLRETLGSTQVAMGTSGNPSVGLGKTSVLSSSERECRIAFESLQGIQDSSCIEGKTRGISIVVAGSLSSSCMATGTSENLSCFLMSVSPPFSL